LILIIDDIPIINRKNVINRTANRHVPNKSGIPNNPMELPQDTIGKMMRWYKGRVSFECRKSGIAFAWQSRFHDHIIRDSRALEHIRQYIRDNPLRWEENMYYPGAVQAQ